ncbi:Hypothetical predicted protein [Octopus vulgaris]|uniref:Uncharacterized protein n=1 Tax=Octopus vulgaris TaxID=6645 RepID=A0AA36BIR7_OCTVU|nr:Hypothetical predicted protein [Octopus vulgaris]
MQFATCKKTGEVTIGWNIFDLFKPNLPNLTEEEEEEEEEEERCIIYRTNSLLLKRNHCLKESIRCDNDGKIQ